MTLITGGSRGIGHALAGRLLARGHHVAFTSTTTDGAVRAEHALAEACGDAGRVMGLACVVRDRAAVEPLIFALKDADADVRQQAAFALGQLRDPRAIDALTGALKDSSADVRQQAAFALGQLIR